MLFRLIRRPVYYLEFACTVRAEDGSFPKCKRGHVAIRERSQRSAAEAVIVRGYNRKRRCYHADPRLDPARTGRFSRFPPVLGGRTPQCPESAGCCRLSTWRWPSRSPAARFRMSSPCTPARRRRARRDRRRRGPADRPRHRQIREDQLREASRPSRHPPRAGEGRRHHRDRVTGEQGQPQRDPDVR